MNAAIWVSMLSHAIAYACIMTIVLFKSIGVERHPRFCFWFVMLYKLVFECLEGIVESLPEYEASKQLQMLDSMLQATDALIFLVIICVCGRGYLPRNFIKFTVYIYQMNIVLIGFSYVAYRLTISYSEEDWQAALAVICLSLIAVLEIIVACHLGDRWLSRMVQRIPDMLCLFIFILACIGYLGKELYLLYGQGYPDIGGYWQSTILYCINGILIFTLIFIAVLLCSYMRNYNKSRRIQYAEKRMMMEYYRNNSLLYRQVRRLRHDLSNHMCAAEQQSQYRNSVEDVCAGIERSMKSQMVWQSIQKKNFSARERYEVYQYVLSVMKKYNLPQEAVRFAFDDELCSVVFNNDKSSRSRKMRLWKLKRGPMYEVICSIALQHGITVVWKKRETDFILELH